MENKKLLIITYYWPPSGGSGVQRWVKFVKYLPELGWDPIVLTVDDEQATYFLKDASLTDLVDDRIKVYRTKSFEPMQLASKLLGKKRIPHSGFSNVDKNSFVQKGLRFLRGNLFSVDPRKGWNKYAYKEAKRLISEYNIKDIVTTSPPHSTQLIGKRLKEELDINWICDLRDPWTDIFYYKDLLKIPYLKKKELSIEKDILTKADKIITVSNGLKTIFGNKIENSDKIKVIENGFDRTDFLNVDKTLNIKLKGSFNLLYIGVISELYAIDTFLKVLKRNTLKNPETHLTFVGLQSDQVKELVSELKLDDNVTFLPYTEKSKLINYYNQADLLLLAIPKIEDNIGIITGKIFEYLCMETPIIGIGPINGDAAKILNEVDAGEMFDYSDAVQIESFLENVIQKTTAFSFSNIEKYSRKELTRKLTRNI